MDYNKLIKGIIRAAKKDPAFNIDTELPSADAKVTTTLRLEVKVSKILSEADSHDASVNSTKFVLLRIND